MKVVTAEEMRELDQQASALGITTETLMENAGLAVAKEVRKLLGEKAAGRRILVLVGPGNNGGDGLVAARHLDAWGAEVQLYLCAQRRQGDPQLAKALASGVSPVEMARDEGGKELRRYLAHADAVIDAVLGTGRARPLEGSLKLALEEITQAKKARPELKVVALDLPSGLDSDTGRADPACPSADLTVALAYPKLGFYAFPAREKIGRVAVVDIGMPPHLAQGLPVELMTPSWARALLPPRPLYAHKGTFGRLLVVAGSLNYIGAAYLACCAAIRVGTGLVTLAAPESLHPIFASKLVEVTHLPLPEEEPGYLGRSGALLLYDALQDYQALLIGCGLGQRPGTVELVRESLLGRKLTCPAVLDADALNNLAGVSQWWQALGEAILTPHPGEMARLTGLPAGEIQAHRLQIARRFAQEWHKVIVLKGAHTVVASPDGRALLSPYANPGLASAGTGDVLAGAIAGLLGQGLTPFAAASLGVYLHGAAGEVVRQRLGDAGMAAGDLLPDLPEVIRRLKAGEEVI